MAVMASYMTKKDMRESQITVAVVVDEYLMPGPLEELQKIRFRRMKREKTENEKLNGDHALFRRAWVGGCQTINDDNKRFID